MMTRRNILTGAALLQTVVVMTGCTSVEPPQAPVQYGTAGDGDRNAPPASPTDGLSMVEAPPPGLRSTREEFAQAAAFYPVSKAELAEMEESVNRLAHAVVSAGKTGSAINFPAYTTPDFAETLRRAQKVAQLSGSQFKIAGFDEESSYKVSTSPPDFASPQVEGGILVDFQAVWKGDPRGGGHELIHFKKMDGTWRINGITSEGNG